MLHGTRLANYSISSFSGESHLTCHVSKEMAGHAKRMLAYNGSVDNMKDGDFFLKCTLLLLRQFPLSGSQVADDDEQIGW